MVFKCTLQQENGKRTQEEIGQLPTWPVDIMCVLCSVTVASVVSGSLWPYGARQAPLSMGFSSKNTGVGCHALLQGIFPHSPGIKPMSPVSPALQVDFLPTELPGNPIDIMDLLLLE